MTGRLLDFGLWPMDCSFPDRKRDEGVPNAMLVLWCRTVFPLVTMIVYHFGALVLARGRRRRRPSRHETEGTPAILVVLVVYVSYCIDTFAALLKMFHCVEISSSEHPYAKYEVLGSSELWTGDTSLVCWEGTHLWSSVLAGVGLLGLVGSLCFMFGILRSGQSEGKLADAGFMVRYGILYLAYRHDDCVALYWEGVITLRKILLAAIGEFGRYTEVSGAQMGLAGITIFVFLVAHQIVSPFRENYSEDTFPYYAGSVFELLNAHTLRDRWVSFNKKVTMNALETASLHMSLSVFFTAASIVDTRSQKDDASDILVTACFVLNVFYVLFMFYRLWYGLHLYLDAIAEARGVEFENGEDKTLLPSKAWVILATKIPSPEEAGAQQDFDRV